VARVRQLAKRAGSPVEPRLDQRLQDAALTRADGQGQRALLEIIERRQRARDGFQCGFAALGDDPGLRVMQQDAHVARKFVIELAREHLVDADRVLIDWPRLRRGLCLRQARDEDSSHSIVTFQAKENRRVSRRLVVSIFLPV
jgi:hypothetical protein